MRIDKRFRIDDVVKIILDDSLYLVVGLNIENGFLFLRNPTNGDPKQVLQQEVSSHWGMIKK